MTTKELMVRAMSIGLTPVQAARVALGCNEIATMVLKDGLDPCVAVKLVHALCHEVKAERDGKRNAMGPS